MRGGKPDKTRSARHQAVGMRRERTLIRLATICTIGSFHKLLQFHQFQNAVDVMVAFNPGSVTLVPIFNSIEEATFTFRYLYDERRALSQNQ